MSKKSTPPKEFREAEGWLNYPLSAVAGMLVGTAIAGVLARRLWQIIPPMLIFMLVGIWMFHNGKYMDRRYKYYAFLLFSAAFLATFLAEDWRRAV